MATVFPLIRKICLAHLPSKTNLCAKFHDYWSKTEEGVHSTRDFLYFFKKSVVTMATVFSHIRKICLAHFLIKTHVCAKFCDHWSKTKEGVCSTRLFIIIIKKCAVTMATYFQHIRKMSCTSSHQDQHGCQVL